jgi:hypothetical protein
MKLPLIRLALVTTTTALALHATRAWAEEAPAVALAPPPPPAAESATASQKAVAHPLFFHESFGFNVFTYTGSSGKVPSSTVTPADKATIFQQIGVGYWVHPNIRLQLTGMFGETLSGLKPGASSFTLGAVIPCVFYTNGGFFAGGGPMFAPRAFGTDDFNFGIFTVAGYALPLGKGVSVAGAVQAPVMLAQKDSVAVTPAIILSERF